MNRIAFLSVCAFTVLGLSGCKFVKNVPVDEQAVAADASGDAVRTEQRIEDTFEAKLLPHIREKALDIAAFRTALAQGLDKAGEENANRGSGAGAAWNFSVSGKGTIVSVNLDTRARVAELDTDGDGAGDVTVQLGPVIRGNALRDVAPFYSFDDFRDQIEFAKLGRALNDRISDRIKLPDGDPVGKQMTFTGVVPLKSATEKVFVTPIDVEVTP